MSATSKTSAVILATLTIALPVHAQSPSRPLAFDAISIRPSIGAGGGWKIQPDGFTAANIPIITVLYLAFPQEINATDSFKHVPDWVSRDRFDIIAKVAPDDLKSWQANDQSRFKKRQLEAMLQAALADRCKFAFHYAPAEHSGQALVLSPHGPNLKPSDPAASPATNGIRFSGGGNAVFSGNDKGHQEWTFHNATPDDLANILSDSGHIVRNQTNLTGRYDFVLEQEPYDTPEPAPGQPAPPSPPQVWNLKALGLRLRPIKITISTVIIDHIEKPNEN
jgi:uncharacterized protein (TIGR03435 family)